MWRLETIQKIGLLILVSTFVSCAGQSPPSSTKSDDNDVLSAKCKTSEIQKIGQPWYHGTSGSPTFTYYYEHKKASASAPTVITLPGGPGALYIGTNAGYIPSNYNVINTDPRGGGCNAHPVKGSYYPLDFFSTDYLARDIIGIIKSLNLTNYYIYGKSYGTVLATRLTHLIETEGGVTKPKGVILEGTLGKAFADFSEYLAGGQTEWVRVQSQITPSILSQIKNNTGLLGYTSRQWAAVIATLLSIGEIPGTGLDLLSYRVNPLVDLNSVSGKEAKAALDPIVYSQNVEDSANKAQISIALGCRELWGTFTGFDLVGGNIVSAGTDQCATYGLTLDRPYDSVNYKLTTPIVYIAGNHDAQTPIAHAQYHAINQTKATRAFVTVSGASHGPLDYTIHELGCSKAVWDAMLTNPANFSNALSSCGWTINLQILNPTL